MSEYIIWYILLNISNKNKIKLLREFGCEEKVNLNRDKIIREGLVGNKANKKLDSIDIEINKRFIDYINKEGIGYITISDKEYPEDIKEIEDPPYVLFYKGDLSLLKRKKLAIVGARNCTTYGREVAKLIASELSKNEITIVSGVASGIDSVAHKITIQEEGKTIGVLGCGIDIIYPKINAQLYKEICSAGLLISEFLPGTKPFAYNFPRRNRIISALAEGIIVVEASIKSGSLITATYGLEQGKDIMVVPGSVLNKSSSGCNKLIRDGAHVFTEIDDLYTLFNINKKISKSNPKSYLEESLIGIISDEPKHLDDIVDSVKVDRKVLFGLLFEMQKRNEIICLPGNYYAKLT